MSKKFKKFDALLILTLMFCLFNSYGVSAMNDVNQYMQTRNEVEVNNLYNTYKETGNLIVTEEGPVVNYSVKQQDAILRSYGQVFVSRVEWFDEYIRVTIKASGSDYYSRPLTMRGQVVAYNQNGVDRLSGTHFYAKGTGGGTPYTQKDIWVGNSSVVMLSLENITGNTYGGEAFSVPVASKLVYR